MATSGKLEKNSMPIPWVSNYIRRPIVENRITNIISDRKRHNRIPIIAIGGIRGAGTALFASHYASYHGNPLWVNCRENTSVMSFSYEIASGLKKYYKNDDLLKLIESNKSKDTPSPFELGYVSEISKHLARDKYILCIENFSRLEHKKAIIDLITSVGDNLEGDPTSKFVAIFVISDEYPKDLDFYHHELLKGFESIEATKKFVSRHNVVLEKKNVSSQ